MLAPSSNRTAKSGPLQLALELESSEVNSSWGRRNRTQKQVYSVVHFQEFQFRAGGQVLQNLLLPSSKKVQVIPYSRSSHAPNPPKKSNLTCQQKKRKKRSMSHTSSRRPHPSPMLSELLRMYPLQRAVLVHAWHHVTTNPIPFFKSSNHINST